MVYLPVFGSHPLTIIPKYVGQFFMTLWLLIRHRPSAVIVMSPPIFAALAPMIYCWVTQRPYGLDCHTAAFTHPRFRRLQWLQAAIERRAAVNIVHNDHLRDIVEQRGGRAVIVNDVPVVYQDGTYELSNKFNVTAVCSFNPDEPIKAILDAAERVPDVQFYMTGNPKHLADEIKSSLPTNVQLTGFVSDAAYGALVCNSDLVMSLTTRDHTMLRGGWEAIYQGTPVIVSDWPILRDSFAQGAIHVDNSPASIAKAITDAQVNIKSLRADAKLGMQIRQKKWRETKEELVEALFRQPSKARQL